jgi:hypothetical protein
METQKECAQKARQVAFEIIKRRRAEQDRKHGSLEQHSHSIAEWVLIMEGELQEAKTAWIKKGEAAALHEIADVTAVGFACLEQFKGGSGKSCGGHECARDSCDERCRKVHDTEEGPSKKEGITADMLKALAAQRKTK